MGASSSYSGGAGYFEFSKTEDFNSSITFTTPVVAMEHSIDDDIVFTVDVTGAKIGYSTLVKLTSDGIHNINFSNTFKRSGGSQEISTDADILHNIYFWYDGTSYWYSVDIANLVDAPILLTSSTASDGLSIELTFNKAMGNPTGKHAQFAYKSGGVDKVFTSANLKDGDNTTIQLVTEDTLVYSDILTVSYVPGDAYSQDNGFLTAFSLVSVSNTLASPQVPYYNTFSFIADGNRANLVTLDGSSKVTTILSAVGSNSIVTNNAVRITHNVVDKYFDFTGIAQTAEIYKMVSNITTTEDDWSATIKFRNPEANTQTRTLLGSSTNVGAVTFVTSANVNNQSARFACDGNGIVKVMNINTTPSLSMPIDTDIVLTVVHAAGNIKFYVNGVLKNTQAANYTTPVSFNRFGSYNPADMMNGRIYWMGVYTGKTDAEVLEIYNYLNTL